MTEHPWNLKKWQMRMFGAAAIIGVGGWLVLLVLYGWWTLQPARLATVIEPMPVLNENHEVAIGGPVLLEMVVTKPEERLAVATARYLKCSSSNLVTLTDLAPVNLPVGTYRLVADTIIVPPKVLPGDTCQAVIDVTFKINPIRNEKISYESEQFTVLAGEED